MVDKARKGKENIDTVLAGTENRALLSQRVANYLALTSKLAPACRGCLWWVTQRTYRGLKVRLVGLNTSLLALDDQDRGKLQLGNQQLAKTFVEPQRQAEEFVVVLGHHPFSGGWLADEKNIASRVGQYADVHLIGHLHDPDSHLFVPAHGRSLIRISAGAVHAEKEENGPPTSHGYSLGAIVHADGEFKLRVWPRRWSYKNARFQVDADNVRDGKAYAEYDLRRELAIESPAPPSATTSLPPMPPNPIYVPSGPDGMVLHAALASIFRQRKEIEQVAAEQGITELPASNDCDLLWAGILRQLRNRRADIRQLLAAGLRKEPNSKLLLKLYQ